MALEFGKDKQYTNLSVASVYEVKDNDIVYVGTLDAGRLFSFESEENHNLNNYGKVSKDYQCSFNLRTSGTKQLAGYLLLESSVVRSSNTDGSLVKTIMDVSGTFTSITGIVSYDSPLQYKVKTGKSLPVFSGPDTQDYLKLLPYEAGTTFAVYASWASPSGTVWGAINNDLTRWIIYRTVSGGLNYNIEDNTPAGSTATATGTASTSTSGEAVLIDAGETYVDMSAVMADIESASASSFNITESSVEALHKMQYVIGIPPKITPSADIQYMTKSSPSNNFGRCYTEMFMMGNTVFSIQPCKVKYLPGFNDEQRATFFQYIADAVSNLGDDAAIEGNLTGQLFEGSPDYNNYINTVNMLARVMAIMLGIGDKTYMNTGTKYRNMDYSWYRIQDNSHNEGNDGTIFGTIASGARWVADKLVTSAINDDTYIHFYMTADGTSMSESMTVSTKSSGLESLFNNNLSSIAQEIQFLTGSESSIDFSGTIAEVANTIEAAGSAVGGISQTLGNLVQYGANYLNGGRLVFPQMLDDCNYDRSYRGSCRFISPSGDPEAIFLNCYLPLAYLLPYVLPQMLSDNMYKYPFLCRFNATGLCHCDLAAITNLQIQRGGQDGTCFTAVGLPFEIDVSFDVTPLYSKLMVTSSRHPILFLSNTSLLEYLRAICGISFTGDQIRLKLGIASALLTNQITDTVPSILRGYYSTDVANWLRSLFNF